MKLNEDERYSRQVLLPDFGKSGQEKIFHARVLVIGAGGLGCPVLLYLAAAGIGTIGIVEDDVVYLSNLHRQVLYTVHDIGLPKAKQAATALGLLNPGIVIHVYHERLGTDNALKLFSQYDIVIDGTDNFASRYLINDACVLMGKPLVYGAISQYEGQVAVFNYKGIGERTSVNYRDLFPEPPRDGEVRNCAEAGVLGVLPGIIGTMQANEVIKLITGIGKPLVNELLVYNSLNNETFKLALQARANTSSMIPADAETFEKTDYAWLCAAERSEMQIGVEEFSKFVGSGEARFIDVREPGETPLVTEFAHRRMNLAALKEQFAFAGNGPVVLFCQSGKRSLEAAKYLSMLDGNHQKIYSLENGILSWKNYMKSKTDE